MRYAFRQFAKSPGFTVTAILNLALGIGACTAIFTVVDSVLLRPLAFPDSDRLIVIRETKLPQFPEFAVAPGNYYDWRQQAESFEELASSRRVNFNLTGGSEPLRLAGERITANFLQTFRTLPMLGRGFTAEEADAGAKLALISHAFWQTQFGGRADILDRTISLDGESHAIIGVLPPEFGKGARTQVFTPVSYSDDNQNHGAHYVRVFGRLKVGVAVEQARSELMQIADRLATEHPDTNTGWSVTLAPLLDYTVGHVRPLLFAVLGAVGFLLLIACANVANLLLARAPARAREISVRAALGASRGRIIRQLLGESAVLAGLGAGLGALIAQWGVSALPLLAPSNLPRLAEIAIDGRVLAFTCGLSVLTGIGFGLLPAFQASRVNLVDSLKEGGRGTGEGRRGQRLRGALIVIEVATALVLLVGAGLLGRSLLRLQDVNPGFNAGHIHTASLSLPTQKYGKPEQCAAFVTQALERITAIPGVDAAGVAHVLPFSGGDYNLAFTIVGRPPPPPDASQSALFYAISPDYFRTLGIPLLRGRAFTAADTLDAPRVAIISESLARHYFPDQDPLGQHIHITHGDSEIIGIVADTKHFDLAHEFRVQAYEPHAQVPFDFVTFVVRHAPAEESALPVTALPAAIRSAIYAVDPEQPIASVQSLEDLVAQSVSRQRFATVLFGVFALLALVLSAIGVYGVLAYSVAQRTSEIGLRVALGAQRADVLRLIFRQAGRMVALGLFSGLLGAFALTRFLSSLLFNVGAYDPLTFAAITCLLAAVAMLACLVPAWRATKVDPLVALRAE